jgi:outer membrane protein assembly factor BamB
LKTRILVFLFGWVLLSGCSTLDRWLSRGAQKRSFQVRNVWTRTTTEKQNLGFRKINRFSPLLYNSKKWGPMVIQANAIDGVVAYNREDGKLIWRLPIENGVESSAVGKGSFLFFGGNDGQFYSVDVESGQVLWSFPTRVENLSEPLVEDGVVYFLTGGNSLYALDAENGKQIWLYTRPETSSLSIRGGSKPAYKNGTLYVGFSDGALVALIAKSGQVKWEKQLNRNKRFRDLDTDPLIDGDVLYVLGYDDAAYALRASTGDQVWKFEKGGYGGLLIQGDRLYYATTTDEFVCVDKTTGRQIWTFPTKGGLATSPALLKGVLVFGESQGLLHFIESGTGREVGHFDPGRGVFSPPTVEEKQNRVYFISNEGNLYNLEAKWGRPATIPYLR